MKLPAFIRLTVRNIVVNVDIGTLTFLLGLPALYFYVLGMMFQGTINTITLNGVKTSYISFLAPGIMAMQTLTAGNIGGSLLWSDCRWGMFEQLMVGPFRRSDYLFGIISIAIIFSIGGSAIVLGFAFSTGTAHFTITWLSALYLVTGLVLASILFTSVFLSLAVVVKTMQAYNTVTIILFFMLDFASNAFVPITPAVPAVLREMAAYNPLSAAVTIVRDSLIYGINSNTHIQMLLLALLSAVLFGVSVILYRRVRTGS